MFVNFDRIVTEAKYYINTISKLLTLALHSFSFLTKLLNFENVFIIYMQFLIFDFIYN